MNDSDLFLLVVAVPSPLVFAIWPCFKMFVISKSTCLFLLNLHTVFHLETAGGGGGGGGGRRGGEKGGARKVS